MRNVSLTRLLLSLVVVMFVASVSFAAFRPFAGVRERIQNRPGVIVPHLRGASSGCYGTVPVGCHGVASGGCYGSVPAGCHGGIGRTTTYQVVPVPIPVPVPPKK